MEFRGPPNRALPHSLAEYGDTPILRDGKIENPVIRQSQQIVGAVALESGWNHAPWVGRNLGIGA